MELTEFEAELIPHAPALARLARRLRHSDADDLVQETWVRALAARHRYTPGSNGRAWLMRILCNLAVSEQRRYSRDERLRAKLYAEDPEPEAPPASATTLDPHDGELALRALEQLAPAERRLIELADIDELSYREIAVTLDCPIGTVMSRLHRARRRLRLAAAVPEAPRDRTASAAQTANRRVAA